MQNSKPHVALLASAGMGHLIPVLELGKRLITDHNFTVTIFVVSTDPSTAKSVLESPYPNLTVFTLPFVDISSLVEPSDNVVTKLVVLMRESMRNLRLAFLGMKFQPTALFVDIFGTEAFPIADEFGMLKYVFVTSNAYFLALTIYAPTMEKVVEEEHIKQKKPLQLPGCRPVRFEDTLEAYLKMDDRVYSEYTRLATEIPRCDGILVNSWEGLDSLAIKSLRDPKKLGKVARAPIYPIGPLARQAKTDVTKGKHILEWLNIQPCESVVYVSFGSGGTLSSKQTIELAWGLELSKQRFIWVFHPPMDHDSSESFFAIDDEKEALKAYFPDGFLTRTQETGLIVSTWAPQSEILAHSSIGGFLTHCGWNSTLESITNGVPMITWPLYAEQKLNATLLVEELKVAIRPENQQTDNIIKRETITTMVRKMIESEDGKSIRRRVKELKNSGEKALSEGGSSKTSLSLLVKGCEFSFHCHTTKARGA